MKIAVITGASSGMGREFVKQTAADYRCLDEIWVIGRSEEKLCGLQKYAASKLRILPMDLERQEAREKLRRALKAEKPRIKLLINCAGAGKIGNFAGLPLDAQASCVRLNCEALTAVTHLCLPYMRLGSRIIQMASASAFVPQPGFAVYAASKAYVLSFSRALREELRGRGITVTAVCPGAVDTPFFEHQENPMPEYKKKVMAQPEAVVKKAIRDAARGRELSVYGGSMKAFRLLCKAVPHSIIIQIASTLDKK